MPTSAIVSRWRPYVIVEADDHDAAARMFEGHPQFTIFPGEGVELMPILAIPTGA